MPGKGDITTKMTAYNRWPQKRRAACRAGMRMLSSKFRTSESSQHIPADGRLDELIFNLGQLSNSSRWDDDRLEVKTAAHGMCVHTVHRCRRRAARRLANGSDPRELRARRSRGRGVGACASGRAGFFRAIWLPRPADGQRVNARPAIMQVLQIRVL